MKNIYMILLLLITGSIYAQEKELDIKKLAELVNSDEEFNQYFEDLGWRATPDISPKFKVYKTIWRDTIQMTVAKIQDMSLIELSTDQPKLARRWRRQITRFANLTEAIDTLGVNSQRFELENSQIDLFSYYINQLIIENEKEEEVREYGIRIADKEKGVKVIDAKTTDIGWFEKPVVRARPKGGFPNFRNKLQNHLKGKNIGNLKRVVVRFVVEKNGRVKDVTTDLLNPQLEKEMKDFFKESRWIPAEGPGGKPLRSSFTLPINLR